MVLELIPHFLKDKSVASITPTSSRIVNHVCDRIDFNRDLSIVEYGPGTGVFTSELLKRMNQNSRLTAFETNKDLANKLREKLTDERLDVLRESAECVRLVGFEKESVDYVISGIPFSMIDYWTKSRIIFETEKVLKNNGSFFVYQMKKGIESDLRSYFGEVSKDFFLFNIPPLYVFEARKIKGI